MKIGTEMKKNKIEIKYHFIFWITYFSFNVIRWGSYFNDYWYSLKSNFVEFPLHIIIVYFNISILIPTFILKKKYKKYILFLFLSLFFLYIVRTSLNYFLVSENIWPEAEITQKAFTFNHIVAVILGELYVISLVTLIRLLVDWISARKRIESLQEIQLKTELNFLKAQIQPHFFFNTLNNLYALTLINSNKAPDVVLKLSEIMEYILYEVKEPKTTLTKEIKYINNYIDLEKLRFEKKIHVKLNLHGNIESCKIPPLLFLPFIENCFKHGGKNNRNLFIFIHFTITKEKTLLFTVSNNFNQFNNNTKPHGIGNENIRRRLELLYKKKFILKTEIKKNKYTINLSIPL